MSKDEKPYSNGYDKQCKIAEHFDSYREDLIMSLTQVNETHGAMALMREDTKHLEPIKELLKKIDNSLLSAVLGKDMVPMGVTQTLLADQRTAQAASMDAINKTYVSIINRLCWTFGVIMIVTLGIKYLAPHLFGA